MCKAQRKNQALKEDWVIFAKFNYMSSKTQRRGNSLAKSSSTILARRSPMEDRHLRLLLFYFRFNFGNTGIEYDGNQLMLFRRPVEGSRGRIKNPDDARTAGKMKDVAEQAGLSRDHASLSSCRKGCLLTSLNIRVGKNELQEHVLVGLRERAMNWARGSAVPLTHYLVDDDMEGPLAMVWDWEDAVKFGGNWNKWKIRQGMLDTGVNTEDNTEMETLWNAAYKDREPDWKETNISEIQYSTILGHGDEEGDIRGYESGSEDVGGA